MKKLNLTVNKMYHVLRRNFPNNFKEIKSDLKNKRITVAEGIDRLLEQQLSMPISKQTQPLNKSIIVNVGD